jgi:RNA polymerase sigma-70 factor (ECF subfamily)
MSDDKLLIEVANGSKKAFEELYNLYSSKVYSLAFRYSGVREDAEEITTDVFVKVWQNAKKFRGNSKVSTWIYRITVNTALEYKRKRKPEEVEIDEEIISTQNENTSGTDQEIIALALRKLPEKQRIAIILTQIENYSYKEASRIMGKSIKAIESLVQRGKETLRRLLT